jgi:hypothetical protein
MRIDDTLLPEDGANCAKCDGGTALITFIPRFGEQPAYGLYECRKCRAMVWVEK